MQRKLRENQRRRFKEKANPGAQASSWGKGLENRKLSNKHEASGKDQQRRKKDTPYYEADDSGHSDGDEDEDGEEEEKPITRESVMTIARAVVREELKKPSNTKPRSKRTVVSEETQGVEKEHRLRYCVCKFTIHGFTVVDTYHTDIPSYLKSLARAVMKEKFGISSTEDFALYVPLDQNIIRSYTTTSDPDSGPDKNNLELDMRGKISSHWNKRVIEILVEEAEERLKTDKSYEGLPKCSSRYMADIFKHLVERARVSFNNAQQKFKENGEVETVEEVEQRMVEQKEKALKDVRVNTRRQAVGLQLNSISFNS